MLPGPLCTWYLHGFGARVDRVEPIGKGDMTRAVPPFQDGVSVFYASMNRGNRSCALNLRSEAGKAALRALVPSYDVLIDGFRPGVLEAIGLTAEVLKTLNPTLIVARISGFGQTGPWSQRVGHDLNYVGLAGVPHFGQSVATPGVQVADTSGAHVAAMAILAALYERRRTGEGRTLDISLAEAALGVVGPHLSMLTAENRGIRPGAEFLTGGLPTYRTYRCRDDKWLAVAALEPKFQAILVKETGTLDPEELGKVFLTRDRDDWSERLDTACVSPCLEPQEIADHPQHLARGAVMKQGKTAYVKPPMAPENWEEAEAPALGEHSVEMLLQAGVGMDQIKDWIKLGAVAGV